LAEGPYHCAAVSADSLKPVAKYKVLASSLIYIYLEFRFSALPYAKVAATKKVEATNCNGSQGLHLAVCIYNSCITLAKSHITFAIFHASHSNKKQICSFVVDWHDTNHRPVSFKVYGKIFSVVRWRSIREKLRD